VTDASEEAVINSLLTARTVTGRSGHTEHALPAEAVRRALRAGRGV
jgi:L-aminopeptidase/D-esterase-like protein